MKLISYALTLSSACALSFSPLKSHTSSQIHNLSIQKAFPSSVGTSYLMQKHGVKSQNKHPLPPLKSSTEGKEEDSNDKMVKKIKGRKKRVKWGYTLVAVGYGLFALTLGRILTPLSLYVASGMTTAAGVAYILKGAATNNRLSSDTYKRLNLALGTYGFIGILARDTLYSSSVIRIWTFISFVAMVNCIKGFGYGLKGWELSKVDPIPEFMNGAKSTITTLTKIPSNLKSTGYLVSTLGFSFLTLSKLLDIGKLFIGTEVVDKTWVSRYLFRLNKLILLSAITFTLKDAADRDRLEGTTFIELNFLTAFTSATLAAYTIINQSNVLGGAYASFTCLLCAFNGISSVLKKRSS